MYKLKRNPIIQAVSIQGTLTSSASKQRFNSSNSSEEDCGNSDDDDAPPDMADVDSGQADAASDELLSSENDEAVEA